jgi:hypothetical protein
MLRDTHAHPSPAWQQCLPVLAQGRVAWRIEARSPRLVFRFRTWRGKRRSILRRDDDRFIAGESSLAFIRMEFLR